MGIEHAHRRLEQFGDRPFRVVEAAEAGLDDLDQPGRRRELAVEACQHAIVLRGGAAVAELSAAEMGGEAGARVYRALLDQD